MQEESPFSFSIIAGVTRNWGLGYQGQLPWAKFSEDMKFFSQTTQNSIIIMGRKTWESMNKRSLPKRHSIIVTTQTKSLSQNSDYDKFTFVSNFDKALFKAEEIIKNQSDKYQNTFVIGGQRLYEEALHTTSKLGSIYLTHVNLNPPTDVKFPPLPQNNFYLKEVLRSQKETEITLHPNEDSEPEVKKAKYDICVYQVSSDLKVNYPRCLTQNYNEYGYLNALNDIIEYGQTRPDRTGIGTKSLFGVQFRYNLLDGFPLLTTKKMFWKGVTTELLWFLRGQTDSKILEKQGVNIWTGNTSREFLDSLGHTERREGDGGPIYGFNLRYWGAEYNDCETDYTGEGFDQIKYVIDLLKNNPNSRRILLTMWNPSVLDKACLPSCHVLYQFYVEDNKYIHCSMYQRSGDMGLGVPFNIASASLMTFIFGKMTGLIPKSLTHTVGDCHIYLNHEEPLKRQIKREPRPFPQLVFKDRGQKEIEDFEADDFIIEGYQPYPGIKMDMAV